MLSKKNPLLMVYGKIIYKIHATNSVVLFIPTITGNDEWGAYEND